MSPKKLQTIEEYLSLADWSYKPVVTEGTHGDYFWVATDMRFHEERGLPKYPFRVLAISFDGFGSGAKIYENEPGWKPLGSFAISEMVTTLPKMYFDAEYSYMLIDRPLTDVQILSCFIDFEDFMYCERDRFWQTVDALQPYFYVAGWDHSVFVARGKDLYETVFNEACADESREIARRRELDGRRKMWESQGPERGPEVCVEPDCDRLRIQLTIRCFIHSFCGNSE